MTTKSKTADKNKLSDIDENISKLFDIKKRLGKGAYGIVWKALDRKTNETLAVKKIFDAFRDETDAQRTFREIIFLKAFRTHPNVIKLHNVFKASNNLDIYLIFEYMESDLHNIIKKGTVLKDIHKRYVMYQLINAIKYIHSGNVIHRDLKPSNVLIDSKCRCKLADFGLARSVSKHPMRKGSDLGSDPVVEPLLTDYVATRWYRAPEILVASKRYTKGIDMWSLGCILGEMIRGKPLFQGSSTINQIEKIVNALPDITEHDIDAVGAGFGSVLLSKQISTERNTSLEELLANAPEDAVDLVTSLLVLDPLSRLTAKQALCHHYIEKFRNSAQEIELNMDILPPFRDDIRLTVPEYRSKLYEIVQVPGERHNNSRNVANGKNAIIKQRDHKRELGEHPDLIKKSSKIRQHNSMDYTEKVIPKDPYIINTEKVEKDTQLKSNGLKIHKKSASPVSKQKLHRSSKLQPATEHTEVMPASEKVNGFQAKGKVNYKNTDQAEDALKIMYPLEKRHSIDCGYTISLPVASRPSPKTTTNNYNNSTPCSRKADSADKLLPSFSLLQKMEGVSHNRGVVRDIPIDQHDRLIRSTPLVVLDKKQSIVRNSKSDIISTPTRDRVCYEKRLRKLEEEIEKYKKEVKSFCKESSRYSNQSDTFKPTVTKGTSLPNTQKIRKNGVVKNVSLPTVISNGHASHNVPKKNPYFQLLSKGNREFGKSEFELPYSTGGSGDHIGRVGPAKLHNGGGDYRIKPDSNQRFRPVSKFI